MCMLVPRVVEERLACRPHSAKNLRLYDFIIGNCVPKHLRAKHQPIPTLNSYN